MIENLGLYLFTALAGGVLAAIAMEAVLWVVGTVGWAKADMIVALGSLIIKRRDGAWRVGALVHAIAAIVFAMLYTLLMVKLGYTGMPQAMMLGLGVGFLHGLIVSLGLVWVVADQHPLQEFNEADLAIGLSHLLAHVAFGGVVGIVVGLSPL